MEPVVHYRVHKILPLLLIESQINAVRIPPPISLNLL
jgi:hypothetical protein